MTRQKSYFWVSKRNDLKQVLKKQDSTVMKLYKLNKYPIEI